MATQIILDFFEQSGDFADVPVIDAVEVKADGHVLVKRTPPGSTPEIVDFDMRNLSEEDSLSRTSYAETLYRVVREDADKWEFMLVGGIASGGTLPDKVNAVYTSFPAYPYTAGGAAGTALTATVTPTWLPSAPTYADKAAAAVDAYNKVWLPQKQAWMAASAAYADGVPDIVAQVGYYMKAATAFIKNRFQDPNIAPDVVEAVIQTMAKGAADIDTVAKFAAAIRQYKALWPNGPTQALGWVSITGTTVAQTNLADAVQLGAGTLPSDFNAFDVSWLVANQPGTVTLDDTAPKVGTAVAATATDPDTITASTLAWQWQRRDDDDSEWTDISDATNASYTPVSADSDKQLRATASYTDQYAAGQAASSQATAAVTTS